MRKSITISKDLNEDIKAYCKENGITNSQLIEKATATFLMLYKTSKQIADTLITTKQLKKTNK